MGKAGRFLDSVAFLFPGILRAPVSGEHVVVLAASPTQLSRPGQSSADGWDFLIGCLVVPDHPIGYFGLTNQEIVCRPARSIPVAVCGGYMIGFFSG